VINTGTNSKPKKTGPVHTNVPKVDKKAPVSSEKNGYGTSKKG
jgi:hypothetical protein